MGPLILRALLLMNTFFVSSAILEEAYTRVRVPSGYFLPNYGQDEKAHSTKTDCAFACTLAGEDECTGYVFEHQQCSLGTMDMSRPHVPSYVMDGTDVMIRSHRLRRNVLNVTHIGSLVISTADDWDDAINGSYFSPVAMPRMPQQLVNKPIFGHTWYKGGLMACGGMKGTTVIKKCWRWTFGSGRWSEIGGTLNYGHYYGRLVYAGGKLWMIMGRPTPSQNPHKYVESYDFKLGVWTDEGEAVGVTYGISHFEAVAFDDTKVSKHLSMIKQFPSALLHSKTGL